MKFLITCISALLFLSSNAYSSTTISLPRGSTVSTVAEQVNQNGLLLDIHFYKSTAKPQEIALHLREQFSLMNGEIVTREISKGVFSVGLLNDETYTSFTIEPSALGSTEGFITKTWYSKQQAIPDPRFPITFGATLSSYTGDNIGSSGRSTWVYKTNHNQAYLYNQIAQRIAHEGWIPDSKDSRFLEVDNTRYYSLHKRGRTSEIVISSINGETHIALMEMQ